MEKIVIKLDRKQLGINAEIDNLESISLRMKQILGAEGVTLDQARDLLSIVTTVGEAIESQLKSVEKQVAVEKKEDCGLEQCLYTKRDFVSDGILCEEDWEIACKLNDLANEIFTGLKTDEDKAHFYMDGIYPGYAKMATKILFVAREAYWMENCNYMRVVGESIRNNKIGGWTLNQYPFHRRQFYLAYGILNGFKDWNTEVPYADEICRAFKFGQPDGNLSWAFMNLCKISNKMRDWHTDYEAFHRFIAENSKAIKKEVEILKPDLIIGSGVGELAEILGYSSNDVDRSNCNCFYYKGVKKDGDNSINLPPMLYCYHFSAVKNDRKCYYEAVRDVLKKHQEDFPNLKFDHQFKI